MGVAALSSGATPFLVRGILQVDNPRFPKLSATLHDGTHA
jgi:hypothetical protein